MRAQGRKEFYREYAESLASWGWAVLQYDLWCIQVPFGGPCPQMQNIMDEVLIQTASAYIRSMKNILHRLSITSAASSPCLGYVPSQLHGPSITACSLTASLSLTVSATSMHVHAHVHCCCSATSALRNTHSPAESCPCSHCP